MLAQMYSLMVMNVKRSTFLLPCSSAHCKDDIVILRVTTTLGNPQGNFCKFSMSVFTGRQAFFTTTSIYCKKKRHNNQISGFVYQSTLTLQEVSINNNKKRKIANHLLKKHLPATFETLL